MPNRYHIVIPFLFVFLLALLPDAVAAGLPTITLGVKETTKPGEVATVLQILFILTILSIAPGIILMTTAFTRIVIVLSFVRMAMGTQQMPPRQIIIGLALFLTFFVMSPVLQQINTTALGPYLDEKITQKQAMDNALLPMRQFMFSQTSEKELELFLDISRSERPKNKDDVSTMTLIPAFMLSELKRSFQMGFLIYIPFLVIDMVVASVLMSMGMIMLPPIIISLPFKILIFVLVDGWTLITGSLVQSFST